MGGASATAKKCRTGLLAAFLRGRCLGGEGGAGGRGWAGDSRRTDGINFDTIWEFSELSIGR